MSNFLAIATVTAALSARMTSMAKDFNLAGGLDITTTRPDQAAAAHKGGAWINIFLYQAAPNAAYRNDDLPTRRADGSLAQRPKAALILHYLISMAGDDAALDSHLLLGAVIRELHARPTLSATEIQDVKTARQPLAPSNLDDQQDFVRFSPQNLSVEELSKLWSTFFEIPYVLSVAYEASPIVIETDDTPMQALPVRIRNVYALPFRQPEIDAVVSAKGDTAPIFIDSKLLIKGRQLRGDRTTVLMADKEHLPASPSDITDAQITLAVPAGTQAGIQGLQVIQKINIGTPVTEHHGIESNVATFILRPKVKLPIVKAMLQDHGVDPKLLGFTVELDVTVGTKQRAVALLNDITAGSPQVYSFPAQPLGGPDTKLNFVAPNVPAGTYFLRVTIDGAQSPLDLDPASPTFGPAVTFPLQ